MRRRPRSLLLILLLLIGIWTAVQFVQTLKGQEPAADARILLYEATLFQIELLDGTASVAGKTKSTAELESLKQAAYSAQYTHSKLAEAWGSGLPELASASRLVEWIVRVQIGGDRALNEDEKELLAALGPHFQQLHTAYAGMISVGGQLIGSNVDEVVKADQEIAALIGREAR
jgi:hypothetical protein